MMKLKLVFYMSNEEIFKKDDLSREFALLLQVSSCLERNWIHKNHTLAHRELSFDFYYSIGNLQLTQGACYLMDEDKVKRIIRHDVSSPTSLLRSEPKFPVLILAKPLKHSMVTNKLFWNCKLGLESAAAAIT